MEDVREWARPELNRRPPRCKRDVITTRPLAQSFWLYSWIRNHEMTMGLKGLFIKKTSLVFCQSSFKIKSIFHPSLTYTCIDINFNMLTSNQIIKTLNIHRKEIQRFGVKRIGLFGSFQTNKQHQKSDIDILVEFSKGKKNIWQLHGFEVFFLEKSFGRPVDLVIKEAVKQDLKPSILKSVRYATG